MIKKKKKKTVNMTEIEFYSPMLAKYIGIRLPNKLNKYYSMRIEKQCRTSAGHNYQTLNK